MSTKTKESLKIVSQEEIGTGIFSMWLQADRMAEAARPGFVTGGSPPRDRSWSSGWILTRGAGGLSI